MGLTMKRVSKHALQRRRALVTIQTSACAGLEAGARLMRHFTIILMSLAVLAPGGCSRAKRATGNLPVMVGGRPVAYELTLPQLTSKTRKVAGEIAKPVATAWEGVPHVQRISPHAILGVAEQGDWFFYATSAATDQATHQPVSFIAGYAIKRGGHEIIQWSVW